MTGRTLRPVTDADLPAPRTDEHSAVIVNDAVDALAVLRTPYWLGDSTVHLHALASLLAQAQQMIPDAVAAARDQELSWAQIGQLLNITPRTAARRFRNNQ
jgi:hypothetical protein